VITGIVVALPEELSTLTSAKVEKGHYCKLTDNILIAYAGAGPANARKASELLISKGSGKLISWGCAAALSPMFRPGDLLLPESLLTEQQQKLNCDQNWIDQVRHLLPPNISINCGTLAESSSIVAESKDKQVIHFQTGAVALDMESCAIAETAMQANLPCLIIRTIADPVSMSLPGAVSHALNSEGEIELSKLLQYILLHPLEIPVLIKLGLHFNAAKKTLKSVAKYLDDIVELEPIKTKR
jgi:adenosylhomocysteine nucleosidase